MRKLFFISALAVGGITSCSDKSENQKAEVTVEVNATIAKDVDVTEFKKLVEGGEGEILDVRTPEEVAGGYINGAKHINIYDADFKSKLAELDKEKPVYVYCKSGGRSGTAMEEMKAMGFKAIYNLDGGIGAWNDAEFEKVK